MRLKWLLQFRINTSLQWFQGCVFMPVLGSRGLNEPSRETAQTSDVVSVRLLESSWPRLTSVARNLDTSSEQQAWHCLCVPLDAHPGKDPWASQSHFSHWLGVSHSSSWEEGHLLTLRKTEGLNWDSHSLLHVSLKPWQQKWAGQQEQRPLFCPL